MRSPKVNEGFSGPLKYNPELVEELKKRLEELKKIYPINDYRIELTSTTDKRWKTWKDHNEKEKEIDYVEQRLLSIL